MENDKNNNNNFVIECPICKMKHQFPLMERGRYLQFACSDYSNTDGIGCKSVITIRVAEKGYNDK